MALPKFLEHIVILCFERRISEQNSVIRLKSNILPPKKIFGPPNSWTGYSHWALGPPGGHGPILWGPRAETFTR